MIHFFFENIDKFTLSEDLETWMENIITTEEKKLGDINYIFCNDEYLLKINQDYLQHDYYTDIILNELRTMPIPYPKILIQNFIGF